MSKRTIVDLQLNNFVNQTNWLEFTTTTGTVTNASTADVTLFKSLGATIPIIGLTCMVNATRTYRMFQNAYKPNITGFNTTITDPYVDIAPSAVDKAIFNQSTGSFAVGIKAVKPPANKTFAVGDQIAVSVMITSTGKFIKGGLHKLHATSYTTTPTMFTANPNNLNADGTLSATLSTTFSNACGSSDAANAVAAIINTGSYTQQTIVTQNGVQAGTLTGVSSTATVVYNSTAMKFKVASMSGVTVPAACPNGSYYLTIGSNPQFVSTIPLTSLPTSTTYFYANNMNVLASGV